MNKKLRQKVYDKFDGHCAYCGTPIKYKDMQVDHVFPKRLFIDYYDHDKIDHIDNLMPSCRLCNHYKRGNTLEGYRRLLITLHERVGNIYIVKVAMKYGLLNLDSFDGKFYFEKIEKKEQ